MHAHIHTHAHNICEQVHWWNQLHTKTTSLFLIYYRFSLQYMQIDTFYLTCKKATRRMWQVALITMYTHVYIQYYICLVSEQKHNNGNLIHVYCIQAQYSCAYSPNRIHRTRFPRNMCLISFTYLGIYKYV